MPGDLLVEKFGEVSVVRLLPAAISEPAIVARIARQLSDLLDELRGRRLVLDFEPVRYLTSHLLGTLVEFRQHLKAAGGDMLLCGLRPELEQVLKAANLHRVFQIQPTREAALAHLGVAEA